MEKKGEYVSDSKNTLWRRQEQLRRWEISDTNKESDEPRNTARSRIKFDDGCIFLAACSSCDTSEVERLLANGADINTTNVDGLTALHQACIDNNMKMVKFLVEKGADVNACDNEGWTALHATASCGVQDIAKYLIDHGAHVDAVNNDSELPVDLAEANQMKHLLTEVMNKIGIDADSARNEELETMTRDAKAWLICGIYDEKPHPKTGAYAMHIAAAKGYIDVMRLLMKAGADINAFDNDGWTPLHAASHWGQPDACELLANNMANMTAVNLNGQTPFDLAAPELGILLKELQKKQEMSHQKNFGDLVDDDVTRPNLSGARRSSIIRMSSERKQDVVTKTADDERRQMRSASIDEEQQGSDELDEDENESDDHDLESDTKQSEVMDHPLTSAVVKQDNNLSSVNEADVTKQVPAIKDITDEGAVEQLSKPLETEHGNTSDVPDALKSESRETLQELPTGTEQEKNKSTMSGGVIKLPVGRSSSAPLATPRGVSLLTRHEPLQRRPYKSVFSSDDESKSRGISPLSAISRSSSSVSGSPSRISSSETSLLAPPVSRSASTNANGLSTSSATSITAPSCHTTAMLAQLSYVQPSIELLRRRRDTTDATLSGGSTVVTSSSSGSHLLSSATVAALAALANTPRRSIDVPKRDEEKEVERKARAKKARETRRSTQGVSKDDLVKAEQALQAADVTDDDTVDAESVDTLPSIEPRKLHEQSLHQEEDSSAVKDSLGRFTTDSTFVNPMPATCTVSAPMSRPVSEYRYKYLQGKEKEEAQRKQLGDAARQASLSATDESKEDDPSQKSAAIRARRKRDSRRSTGKVNADEIQSLMQEEDEDSKNVEDDTLMEMKPSRLDYPESDSVSTCTDPDYRKLYEAERNAAESLRLELKQIKQQLSDARCDIETLKVSLAPPITRKTPSLETQSLEKRIAELEEQVKSVDTLKADNQRLKDENGALIRVISKLSK